MQWTDLKAANKSHSYRLLKDIGKLWNLKEIKAAYKMGCTILKRYYFLAVTSPGSVPGLESWLLFLLAR